MYPPFISHSKKLLSDNGIKLTFVDVGSRNGIIELTSISEFVDAYGFEPNPDEYNKLVKGETDAAKIGIMQPKYNFVSYSPYAVGDASGQYPFYITHGPGAAGMREPNVERLEEIKWKGATYKKNFAEDVFVIDKVVDVDTKTLADFAKEKSLAHIDYLKIDVEGSEYEVLSGVGDLLSNVGVIKAEICFIPMRKGQKLFSDVDLLLRKHGFDLLRYEISPAQVGLKERTTSWSFGSTVGFPERYGQPLQADAVYVNRSITNLKRRIAQALVLLDKNYLDEALFILKKRAKVDAMEFLELLGTYKGQWRTRFLDGVFRLARYLFKPSPHLWK